MRKRGYPHKGASLFGSHCTRVSSQQQADGGTRSPARWKRSRLVFGAMAFGSKKNCVFSTKAIVAALCFDRRWNVCVIRRPPARSTDFMCIRQTG